nr:hypothetical protein CFP56_76016 [Quercus suber]
MIVISRTLSFFIKKGNSALLLQSGRGIIVVHCRIGLFFSTLSAIVVQLLKCSWDWHEEGCCTILHGDCSQATHLLPHGPHLIPTVGLGGLCLPFFQTRLTRAMARMATGLITPVPPKAPTSPLATYCDPNARCKYQIQGRGHWTYDCYYLKHKIQELIDKDLWSLLATSIECYSHVYILHNLTHYVHGVYCCCTTKLFIKCKISFYSQMQQSHNDGLAKTI